MMLHIFYSNILLFNSIILEFDSLKSYLYIDAIKIWLSGKSFFKMLNINLTLSKSNSFALGESIIIGNFMPNSFSVSFKYDILNENTSFCSRAPDNSFKLEVNMYSKEMSSPEFIFNRAIYVLIDLYREIAAALFSLVNILISLSTLFFFTVNFRICSSNKFWLMCNFDNVELNFCVHDWVINKVSWSSGGIMSFSNFLILAFIWVLRAVK